MKVATQEEDMESFTNGIKFAQGGWVKLFCDNGTWSWNQSLFQEESSGFECFLALFRENLKKTGGQQRQLNSLQTSYASNTSNNNPLQPLHHNSSKSPILKTTLGMTEIYRNHQSQKAVSWCERYIYTAITVTSTRAPSPSPSVGHTQPDGLTGLVTCVCFT